MKRFILISAALSISVSCLAQTECGQSHPIFNPDHYGPPKEIHTLGANPEFPFLRNLSTPQQVVSAIKRNTGKPGMAEFNGILKEIGFANGAKDIKTSAITAYYFPFGTTGNMGDGNFGTSYTKLMTGDQTKTWKITSPSGCYVYFLAKCGNAFYPVQPPKAATTLDVPLNLNSESKEIVLQSGTTRTTTSKTYIYYHRNKHRTRPLAPEYADLKDPQASTPLLINTAKKVEAVPQNYKISVSTPYNNIRVYEDQPLEVTANIGVEKTNEYAGYYPSKVNTQYNEVRRCVYKRSERKMRNAARKQEKVSQMTGVDANAVTRVNR